MEASKALASHEDCSLSQSVWPNWFTSQRKNSSGLSGVSAYMYTLSVNCGWAVGGGAFLGLAIKNKTLVSVIKGIHCINIVYI